MKTIIILLLIISTKSFSFDVICHFKKTAIVESETTREGVSPGELSNRTGNYKSSNTDEDFSFIIKDVNGTPRMVGNNGEDSLIVLSYNKRSRVLYLLETTESGNVNLITLFGISNDVIYTKQYDLNPFPTVYNRNLSFGMTMIGTFSNIEK